MNKVDVISSCLVKMASNVASMSRMELTPWDLQMLLLDPIQKGILFHKPAHQSLIHHLKTSLSRTLDFFPPLSGRIAAVDNGDNTASFFVDCNDAGVEFVHAVAANVSVSDILEPTYIPEIVSSFFPLNGILNCEGVSKPLLGVQVTELVDGLFIACTANHSIVDGISFWHFFNSWSEISRGFQTISKPPVFERWFPHLPIPLPASELNPSLQTNPAPLLERVFHFNRESLAKLKSKTNVEGISSLQALSAHLWWSTTRCRRQNDDQRGEEEARLMMVVGARARIPLPEGYFGNGAIAATMGVSEVELLEKGLNFAATKINEFVGRQTKEGVIKFEEDWVKKPLLYRKGSALFSLAITSSPRHDVYGNDFGWGKPIAVRSGKAQKSDGKMTMYPAAVAGGIDVEVSLDPQTLRALENDAEFMEAFFD